MLFYIYMNKCFSTKTFWKNTIVARNLLPDMVSKRLTGGGRLEVEDCPLGVAHAHQVSCEKKEIQTKDRRLKRKNRKREEKIRLKLQ
jgi:hypothetical protein